VPFKTKQNVKNQMQRDQLLVVQVTGYGDSGLCQVVIKKANFPTGMILLGREAQCMGHHLNESFRVKIPPHLRKLIEEVVKDYAYKQVLTSLKACDENGECRLDMLARKSVTM
jgi:hypothetical protein